MIEEHKTREKLFTIRLNVAEEDRLRRVSSHLGLAASTTFRMILLEKERQLGLAPKRKTKGRKA
jgi:hypothetical protein